MFFWKVFAFLAVIFDSSKAKRSCIESETHYILSPCDQEHGRWRVKVPRSDNCDLASPDTPLRTKCETTCKPGQFYNISGDMRCHACKPGEYSLGSSEEFTNWSPVPKAFSVVAAIKSTTQDNFYDTLNKSETESQCKREPWTAHSDALELRASGNCVVILAYSAALDRAGSFEVAYRHSDPLTMFTLQIENSACQRSHDKERSFKLEPSWRSEWRVKRVPLNSGTSVISLWLEASPINSDDVVPVVIKNVSVNGISYTTECKKCPNGTFSAEENSPRCIPCSMNTYAPEEGSTECKKCDTDQFSKIGWAECKVRQPCKSSDYYPTMSPCDQYGNSIQSYSWIEPKLCNDKLEESLKLPQDVTVLCPTCNPGQFKKRTIDNKTNQEIHICSFCPAGHYSNGSLTECKPCSKNSYSISGIFWQRWQQGFPTDVVTNTCYGPEMACSGSLGWQGTSSNHLESVRRHSIVAYSMLSFRVERIHPPVKLSIKFQTVCDDACLFMIVTTADIGESEEGYNDLVFKTNTSMSKPEWKTFDIEMDPPYSLHIIFRKLTPSRLEQLMPKRGLTRLPSGDFDENTARIYQLNFTNVEPGGMAECYDCAALQPKPPFCRTCPAGSFHFNESTCAECPPNHYTPPVGTQSSNGLLTFAIEHSEQCKPCPKHMRPSQDGLSCYSDCQFNFTSGSTRFHWDMSAMGLGIAESRPMLLPSGTSYAVRFNVTLCGQGKPRECQRGRTTASLDFLSWFNERQATDVSHGQSRVCSAMVLESSDEVWTSSIVGGRLVSVAFDDMSKAIRAANVTPADKDLPAIFTAKNLPAPEYSVIPDVLFIFQGDETSSKCPNGLVTVVVARCDPRSQNNSAFTLPTDCPAGSCDNCNYLLLWTSSEACPRCDDKENDYELVEGSCSFGSQTVWRYPRQHCLLIGKEREEVGKQACSPLPLSVEIGLVLVAALVVVLVTVLLVTCKRTRKLEYRYMKLVESTGLEADELPQVESCAVEVDAPDDIDDTATSAQQTDTAEGTMERMRIAPSAKKTKKFRTIGGADRGYRGTNNNAFFEPADSSSESLMQATRPSVL